MKLDGLCLTMLMATGFTDDFGFFNFFLFTDLTFDDDPDRIAVEPLDFC